MYLTLKTLKHFKESRHNKFLNMNKNFNYRSCYNIHKKIRNKSVDGIKDEAIFVNGQNTVDGTHLNGSTTVIKHI